jgi:hypothetical protein
VAPKTTRSNRSTGMMRGVMIVFPLISDVRRSISGFSVSVK